jgi:hypothetical protein
MIKIIFTIVILLEVIILSQVQFQLQVYAQEAGQTIQQIQSFPVSIIISSSNGHQTRMMLTAIINVDEYEKGYGIVWENSATVTTIDNKLVTDNSNTVSVNTKQHLFPLTARYRNTTEDVRLDTIFYAEEGGFGEFSLDNIENQGIYVIDIIIKSAENNKIGIYESLLVIGDMERDDLQVMQLTQGLSENELLRFATINLTNINR